MKKIDRSSSYGKKILLAILYMLYFFTSFLLIYFKIPDVIVFVVAGIFLAVICVVSFYDIWRGVLTNLFAVYLIEELWVAFLTLIVAILGIGTLKIKSGEFFESFIKASGFVLTVYGFAVKVKSHRPKLLSNIELLEGKPLSEIIKKVKVAKTEEE